MTSDPTSGLVRWLRRRDDCTCEDGLTDAELDRAESRFGVRFPAEWRAVLAQVHPVSLPKPPRGPDGVLAWTRFPDWRGREGAGTWDLLAWPVDGIVFDVEHSDFWWPAWGPRPDGQADRAATARSCLAGVPQLIPVAASWYLAPQDDGPVISLHQTDLVMIAAGAYDMPVDRSHRVFPPGFDKHYGGVPFWSELARWSAVGPW